MKTCVLIASHISYEGQIELLYNCLMSLKNQTYQTDIYLSISFDNIDYKEHFIKTIIENEISENIIIKISDIQKYQMEHIYILKEYINDYDLIMFCDDDDTYSINRVEEMVKNYKILLSNCEEERVYGITENQYEVSDYTEFWSYAIKPALLNMFYDHFKDDMDLLKHKFGDMYLRTFLRFKKDIIIGILVMKLYNYNNNNPNSICTKKKSVEIIIRDDLILSTICGRYSKFNYILNHYNLNTTDVYKYVPEYDRIEKIANNIYLSIH